MALTGKSLGIPGLIEGTDQLLSDLSDMAVLSHGLQGPQIFVSNWGYGKLVITSSSCNGIS